MKRLIIAFVAITMAFSVSAQDLRWGVTGGLNFSWEKAKLDALSISSDCYIGFQAGVKAEMDFADYIADGFFLEGSLLYNLKGSSFDSAHTNLGYLQLPVNLGYRYPVSSSVSLLAAAGPYLGLGILGKDVEKLGGTKVKTDVFGSDLQRFDFGLNYKLGIEMWDQWQFYLGFEHSLLNIAKTDDSFASDDVKCRFINLYIGTALMF